MGGYATLIDRESCQFSSVHFTCAVITMHNIVIIFLMTQLMRRDSRPAASFVLVAVS